MKDTKPFYASLGVMGPLSGLAMVLINQFVFGGNEVITENEIKGVVDAIAVAWTGISGIWGRWRAKTQIGSRA